ncbi:MAG TPA: hypothetical protein VMY37_29755 [Thermoguttaceae bacterium]|nr:hypothetical protein [Thermoguttaceae bacterium]
MQTAKQISVRLVNKPGRLASMLEALHKGKVDFRALVVMDSGDRGTVRFVPDDAASATKVLDKINIRYDVADVLLVDVPKQPGAFRNVCERLAAEHLNIDYAYSSFASQSGTKGGGLAVVKVNNPAKAQKILGENNHARRKKAPPVRRPPAHAR